LQLHRGAGDRQYRELGAFVHYCVSRIERELGEIDHWSVTIGPAQGGFVSVVAITREDEALEATGVALDGALAAWEAMCKLEQQLRELRAGRPDVPARNSTSPDRALGHATGQPG
jgi:hypothetical protein